MHCLPFKHSDLESVQKHVWLHTITLDTDRQQVRSASRHTAPGGAGTSPKLLHREMLCSPLSTPISFFSNETSPLPKEIRQLLGSSAIYLPSRSLGISKCQSAHWTIKVDGCS